MIDERQEELAALAALDLLDGTERTEFEAALAQNPALLKHVAEMREAACALAHLAPCCEPPEALRARILLSIGHPQEVAKPRARLIPFPVVIPWALAACLAAVAAWSGERYMTVRSEYGLLSDQQKLADLELQRVHNQMEEERIVYQRELADNRQQLTAMSDKLAEASQQASASLTQLASLTGKLKVANNLMRLNIVTLVPTGAGDPKMPPAVTLWDSAKQEGMLDVKLPALESEKVYQLWAIDSQYNNSPVSSGVFRVDPVTCTACIYFKPDKPIKVGAKFAISLERKGGVPKPEGPIVMLSD
jgi:anti-sigma-K factor RskA